MPVWFHLLLAIACLILPGGADVHFGCGAKRWHLLLLLPLMALFGLHEQLQLLPALYVNLGGFFLPVCYALYLLFKMPKPARRRGALCILLGGVGSFLCISSHTSWADANLGGVEPLRMLTMAVYALVFTVDPMEGLCAYVLGFSFSGLLQYVDQLLFEQTAYLSLGVGRNFIVLITGGVAVFFLQALLSRRRGALRPKKSV